MVSQPLQLVMVRNLSCSPLQYRPSGIPGRYSFPPCSNGDPLPDNPPPIRRQGVVVALGRADVFVAHHLGRHGHWHVPVHHGLDKEDEEGLGANWPARLPSVPPSQS